MNEVNQQCLKQLRECKLCNRVAVIGSGLSIPAAPSITDVVAQLSEEVGLNLEQGENHWDFFQRAHDCDPERYFTLIRDIFSNLPHVSCRSYKLITAIPFQGFITFNYDDQLPTALRDKGTWQPEHHFKVFPSMDFFAPMKMRHPPQKLLAIHGYISPENPEWHREIILRRHDYDRHYVLEGAQLKHWWENLLLDGNLLFLGTSLREPGLFKVIEDLIPDYMDQLLARGHFHLTPISNESDDKFETEPLFTHRVIQRIYYDPVDKRHTGLLDILSHLTNIPFDSPSPRITIPQPISIGENLHIPPL